MPSEKSVILKGELHSSGADRRHEVELLDEGVDVVVLEQSETPGRFRPLHGWFYVSIALLTWLIGELYQSKEVLVELATTRDIEVVYTRQDNGEPLETASRTVKWLAAGLFYLFVPGSLWIGFLTADPHTGALLLFLGLVLPVLVVRLYNVNRADGPENRDTMIAETISDAAEPGNTVLAIVGAGHLPGVERRLTDRVPIDVHPPEYGMYSVRHLRDVGVPTIKAGLVLFSLYVACLWFVVQVVDMLVPVLAAVL